MTHSNWLGRVLGPLAITSVLFSAPPAHGDPPPSRRRPDPQNTKQIDLKTVTEPASSGLQEAQEEALSQIVKAAGAPILEDLKDAPVRAKAIAVGLLLLPKTGDTGKGLSRASISAFQTTELIAMYYELLFSRNKGRIEFAKLLHRHLTDGTPRFLREEYALANKPTLFSAYLTTINPIVSVKTPSADIGQDAIYLVSLEYDIIARLVGNDAADLDLKIKAISEFYRRRYAFKEAALARSKAFSLYCKKNTSDGFVKFVAEFGTNCPEFPAALARRRLSDLRDTMGKETALLKADKEHYRLEPTKSDWATTAPKSIELWDTLTKRDLDAPHVYLAHKRSIAIAIELEKLNQAKTARKDRAELLFDQARRLSTRLQEKLGTGGLNNFLLRPTALKALRDDETVDSFLQLERIRAVLSDQYAETPQGIALVAQQIGFLDWVISLSERTDLVLAELRKGFSGVSKDLQALGRSIDTRFDEIHAQLKALESNLNDFRMDTGSKLAQLARDVKKLDEGLSRVEQKVDGLTSSIAKLADDMHSVMKTVEEIKIVSKEQAAQVAAMRKNLFPAPWPGDGKTDALIQSWDVEASEDVKGALGGVIEARIRQRFGGPLKEEDKEINRTEWVEVGPPYARFKTIVAEYTIKYGYYVELLPDYMHFNINNFKLGFDKHTQEAYFFIDLTGLVRAKGSAYGRGGPFVAADVKFDADGRIDAKLKCTISDAGRKWEFEVREWRQSVERLDTNNDLLNLFREDLRKAFENKLPDNLKDDVRAELSKVSRRMEEIVTKVYNEAEKKRKEVLGR